MMHCCTRWLPLWYLERVLTLHHSGLPHKLITFHFFQTSPLQAFAVQSYVTGEGPNANWSKHVADPFGYNLLTGAEERTPTL